MATAADYLRAYREQTGMDAVAAIESVVEFLSVYGMTEAALDVLCGLIDGEGTTRDCGPLGGGRLNDGGVRR